MQQCQSNKLTCWTKNESCVYITHPHPSFYSSFTHLAELKTLSVKSQFPVMSKKGNRFAHSIQTTVWHPHLQVALKPLLLGLDITGADARISQAVRRGNKPWFVGLQMFIWSEPLRSQWPKGSSSTFPFTKEQWQAKQNLFFPLQKKVQYW